MSKWLCWELSHINVTIDLLPPLPCACSCCIWVIHQAPCLCVHVAGAVQHYLCSFTHVTECGKGTSVCENELIDGKSRLWGVLTVVSQCCRGGGRWGNVSLAVRMICVGTLILKNVMKYEKNECFIYFTQLHTLILFSLHT